MSSTNYYNTFIEIAEDCPATGGTTPPQRGTKKSVANYEYEILSDNPYRFSSDDVIFEVLHKEMLSTKMRWKNNESYISQKAAHVSERHH